MARTSLKARIADLAWPEIEMRIGRGALAVLPVGAGAKEHGRHLPLSTDLIQVEWLAERLAERIAGRLDALIWPSLNYGHYPAFTDFPGSCSLRDQVFEMLAVDVVDSITAAGARHVLVVNTGISTIPALDRIAASRAVVKLAHVYRGHRYRECEAAVCRQPRGGHADEAETSIMLAIAPERVVMSETRPWTSTTIGRGKFVRSDPAHPNYAPDGVFGDPTLATQQKGERLLAAMLADVEALLSDLA